MAEPNVRDNTPTTPAALEGGRLIARAADPAIMSLADDAIVTTSEITFEAIASLSAEDIARVFDEAVPRIANMAGQQVLSYFVWEAPGEGVTVPEEICFESVCVTPPFAGSVLASTRRYRVYVLSRDAVSASASVRGQWQILTAGIVALVLIPVVVGAFEVLTGNMKWSELTGAVKGFLPGGQAGEAIGAFSWPMVAFGASIVVAAIVAPEIGKVTSAFPKPTVSGTLSGRHGNVSVGVR